MPEGMGERGKSVCPECGAEMNRHAEKADYTAGDYGAEVFNSALGAVAEEFHACPDCGHTHTRPAA